jgi:elongation factor Tu
MNRMHDIEGMFHLLESKHGGRKTPVSSGYRPGHKVHENYLTSAQHKYLDVPQVMPGETARVALWFVTPDVYPGSLWVGRELDVQEGNHTVGKLVITHVINQVLLGTPETYNPIWVEPPSLSKPSS